MPFYSWHRIMLLLAGYNRLGRHQYRHRHVVNGPGKPGGDKFHHCRNGEISSISLYLVDQPLHGRSYAFQCRFLWCSDGSFRRIPVDPDGARTGTGACGRIPARDHRLADLSLLHPVCAKPGGYQKLAWFCHRGTTRLDVRGMWCRLVATGAYPPLCTRRCS